MNDKKHIVWIKVFFLIAIIAIMSSFVAEVHGQSIYDSQRILHSGRGIALARAYVAEVSDVSGMLINPAALSYLKDYSASITYYHELKNQMLSDDVIIPWKINKQNAIGFGLTRFTYGQTQYGADLVYSYRISTPVAVGIICQPRFGISSSSKKFVTTTGFGLFYSPSLGVRYGFSVLGIGNSLDYDSKNDSYFLNRKTKVTLGTSMNFPSWLKRPIMNLSASTERYVGEENFRYSIGLEISPFEFLDLRVGLIAGHSDDPQKDHGLSCGIGLRSGIFAIDYGIGQSIFDGIFHQVSLRMQVEKIFKK
jgi:hypothetical protein